MRGSPLKTTILFCDIIGLLRPHLRTDRKTAAPERGSRFFAFAGLQLLAGEVLQGVRFGDLADDTAGIARRQHAVGDIVGDHAAGAVGANWCGHFGVVT